MMRCACDRLDMPGSISGMFDSSRPAVRISACNGLFYGHRLQVMTGLFIVIGGIQYDGGTTIPYWRGCMCGGGSVGTFSFELD